MILDHAASRWQDNRFLLGNERACQMELQQTSGKPWFALGQCCTCLGNMSSNSRSLPEDVQASLKTQLGKRTGPQRTSYCLHHACAEEVGLASPFLVAGPVLLQAHSSIVHPTTQTGKVKLPYERFRNSVSLVQR